MATSGTKNQGIKIFIGTQATDPASDTYTQIKRAKMIGEFGSDAAVIDATGLEDTAKQKLKGIPDSGDVEVGGNRVFTDAGQNALRTAGSDNSDTPYNFRIEIPAAGTAGADLRYSFKAIVSKFMNKPGSVDSLVEFTSMLAITGTITEATF